MAKYKLQGANKTNRITLGQAIELMIRNIKSGNTIYITFSKKTFHILVFTLAMSIIANLILVYIIVNSLINSSIGSIDKFIYVVMSILSITTIFSGFWLVFKGIDIVTDEADFK